MSRTPARVTQADVARALRAVEQTGGRKEVIIEPDGRIRIVPAEQYAPAPTDPNNQQPVDFSDDISL